MTRPWVGIAVILVLAAAAGAAAWLLLGDDVAPADSFEGGGGRRATPRGPQDDASDTSGGSPTDVAPPGEASSKSETVAPAPAGAASVLLASGAVRTRTGLPIPDPGAVATAHDGTFLRIRGDGEGLFRVMGPPGRLRTLVVGARGYANRRFEDVPEGTELVVLLDAAVPFRGTVSAVGGPPIPRATLRLRSVGHAGLEPLEATTGGTGAFSFETVAPGRYALSVEKDGFAPVHEPGLVIPAPAGLRRDYVLEPGLVLEGLVTAQKAKLIVQGAQIVVLDRIVGGRPVPGESRTLGPYVSGSDGRFRVEALLPGTHVVLIRAHGFGATFTGVEMRSGGVTQTSFDLPPAGVLAGRVVDASDAPVAGALVVIRPTGFARDQFAEIAPFLYGTESWSDVVGERWPAVRTDGRGAFSVPSAPPSGQGHVQAIDPDGRFSASASAAFDLGRGAPNVVLRLGAGTVVLGHVRNTMGAPVAEARVSLSGVRALSDDAGAFRLAGVRPGKQRMTVVHQAFLRFEAELEVPEAGLPDVDVALDTGAQVVGRVVDRRNQPLISAFVSARNHTKDRFGPQGTVLASGFTDLAGRFLLGGFRADRVDVVAQTPGYAPETIGGTVPDGRQDLLFRLDEQPWALGGDVAGSAVDALTQAPVLEVEVLRIDPRRVIVVDGAFLVRNLPPGRTTLELSAPGYQRSILPPFHVIPGETVDLPPTHLHPASRIEVPVSRVPPGGRLRVRLAERGAQGNPPSALEGQPKSPGSPVFIFEAVRRGPYRLIIEAAGRATVRRDIDVKEATLTVSVRL